MRLYYNLGARVTINTDNRLVTDTSMTKELYLLHTEMGFSLADVKQVLMNGFKSAFMPFHEKQSLLLRINEELQQFSEAGFVPQVAAEHVSE